jgi:hypothetical protein
MPAAKWSERRRQPRVRALYHVVITSNGVAEELSVTVGRTVDVSEMGVRVETPGHLSVDDIVRLEIAVEETVVDARGRVIRTMRIGELIEAGIEFTVISDSDRLAVSAAR